MNFLIGTSFKDLYNFLILQGEVNSGQSTFDVVVVQKNLFIRLGGASDDFIALRKTPETFDNIVPDLSFAQ